MLYEMAFVGWPEEKYPMTQPTELPVTPALPAEPPRDGRAEIAAFTQAPARREVQPFTDDDRAFELVNARCPRCAKALAIPKYTDPIALLGPQAVSCGRNCGWTGYVTFGRRL
jgi:ribosomal protein S27AE